MPTTFSPTTPAAASGPGLPPPPPGPRAIPRNAHGLGAALAALGIQVRFNSRRAAPEYRRVTQVPSIPGLPVGDWVPKHDLASAAIRQAIEDTHRWEASQKRARFGTEAYEESLNALVASSRVDPFYDWLMDDLPAWDGTSRLGSIFVDAFDAEDSPLVRHAGLFLLAAVDRTVNPGAKHDWLPIVIGPQGCGKSTFVRLLCAQSEWFGDSVDLSAPTVKQVEATLGKVLIEFSELTGIRRTEAERLKTFLSSQSETVRLSFRRDAAEYPRQWAGVGTSNAHHSGILPTDRTGYRRFVVVECGPGASSERVRDYLDRNRDLLWAEALHMSLQGESHHLPDDLEKEMSAKSRRFAQEDDQLDDAALGLTEKHRNGQAQLLKDMLVESGLVDSHHEAARNRSLQRSLGGALRELGWAKRQLRRGGAPKMLWFPPQDEVQSPPLPNL